MQPAPRVPTQVHPRVEKSAVIHNVAPSLRKKAKQCRKRRAVVRMSADSEAPSRNTRAQTKRAADRAAEVAKPAADGTRKSTKEKTVLSQLMRPTVSPRSKMRTENAMHVELRASKRQMQLVARCMSRLVDEVHQAMAFMDADTGKLLNYKQLMKDPKQKKRWAISSANEFGRLANGTGGRVKGTNTIQFIRKRDVPSDRRKDVTYGSFVCSVRPEKKEKERVR